MKFDVGKQRAAALLAGADGDAAPVLQFLLQLFWLQRCLRALGVEQRDARGAELGRLLNRPVHVIGAAESLDDFATQRGLGAYGDSGLDTGAQLLALD